MGDIDTSEPNQSLKKPMMPKKTRDFLILFASTAAAGWLGTPHLDLTLLFIAGVALIEWREFRDKP